MAGVARDNTQYRSVRISEVEPRSWKSVIPADRPAGSCGATRRVNLGIQHKSRPLLRTKGLICCLCEDNRLEGKGRGASRSGDCAQTYVRWNCGGAQGSTNVPGKTYDAVVRKHACRGKADGSVWVGITNGEGKNRWRPNINYCTTLCRPNLLGARSLCHRLRCMYETP